MTQQTPLPEMVAQSRDVLSNPSVPAFERYERRGTLTSAAIYVGAAALAAGLLGLVASFFPGPPEAGIGGFLGGFLGALAQFFVFTGLVYFLGRSLYEGSGSWDEVAYTFSLFVAPLILVGGALTLVISALGWIPLLGGLVALAGFLVSLVLLLAQIYYGYLAVQSSMNIRNPTKALIVQATAAVGTLIILGALAFIF